jgi:hypothetical protein
MWFIETPVFSDQLYGLLSDDEYRGLQLALTLRPEQGNLIRGVEGFGSYAGGCAEEDLTSDQLRLLRRIVQEGLK